MRAGLGVALVGLVICVGCQHESDSGITKPQTDGDGAKSKGQQAPRSGVVGLIEELGGRVKVDENKAVVVLDLNACNFPDAGLVHLKGLTKLEGLGLDYSEVTDAGLEHLKGLTNLRTLSLEDTSITGAGLVHLKGLTKLKTLHLSHTKVTDAGLVHLEGLTELERLFLYNTGGGKVTDAGVKKLQQALPNCKIKR